MPPLADELGRLRRPSGGQPLDAALRRRACARGRPRPSPGPRPRTATAASRTYTSLPAWQAWIVCSACQWSGRGDDDGVEVLAVEQLAVVAGTAPGWRRSSARRSRGTADMMSQMATTSASLCARKASSTWSPRLPRPMKPRRTRSLAPATRRAPRAVATPAAAVAWNFRRVMGVMPASGRPVGRRPWWRWLYGRGPATVVTGRIRRPAAGFGGRWRGPRSNCRRRGPISADRLGEVVEYPSRRPHEWTSDLWRTRSRKRASRPRGG